MSIEAIKWAMEGAPPMPAQLVATLIGLAYHADKTGCGSYPSVGRLSAMACKDKRSVQRDLRALLDLGLIRPGDPKKTAHLPEGKRPEVYDLATNRTVPGGRAGADEMTQASRVTLASSRRRGGRKKPSSDAMTSDLTGDVHVTGDVDVADGVTPTSQEGWRPRHPNLKEEPSVEESPRRDGLHPIPDDFFLNDTMRRWSIRTFGNHLDPDFETQQFISYWRAEGRLKKNWHDAWMKWLRDSAQRKAERSQRSQGQGRQPTPEERGIF